MSIQIYGLQRKAGLTVTANVAGLDCGTYVVASDGSIIVPYGSDPDGALSGPYLITISGQAPAQGWGPTATMLDVYNASGVLTRVVVPVVVGFPYISQGQCVRPNQEQAAKTQQGSGLGVARRVYQFGALVAAGVNDDLAFGTSFSDMRPVSFAGANGVALDHKTAFNGVYWSLIDDSFSFDGMLCWQTSAPQPLILSAVTTFLETEER